MTTDDPYETLPALALDEARVDPAPVDPRPPLRGRNFDVAKERRRDAVAARNAQRAD